MTNMEWYGSNLMRRHQHRFRPFFFFAKNRLSKILFKSFPKKTLRLWISKIRIWIWSEESTLSVDFMNSWSVFGYAQKHSKSVFGFGNPYLDFPEKTHPYLTSMSLLMESVRKVIADCVEYLRPWRRNQHWYLGNRSREPVTSTFLPIRRPYWINSI